MPSAVSVLPAQMVQGLEEEREIPTKTYRLDLDSGHLTAATIDGAEAVKQAAALALLTVRFQTHIYDSQYGSELNEVIGSRGMSEDYITEEIDRCVRDALSRDNRITSVNSVTPTYTDDYALIAVEIGTVYGETTVEVKI